MSRNDQFAPKHKSFWKKNSPSYDKRIEKKGGGLAEEETESLLID